MIQAVALPDWASNLYSDWGPLIRILLTILAALLIRAVMQFMIHRIVKGVTKSVKKVESNGNSPLAQARLLQRTKTIGSVLGNLATWALLFAIISVILSEAGVSTSAIIAGAGILGAGLGFGAQTLIRDLLSGLFIVFEDQYGVGDSVDLGQASGVVESVGLRITQVRDIEGTLWFVRNGEILRVGNQNQGWSRVVIDVALDPKADVAKAEEVLRKAAEATAKSMPKSISGSAEVWGVTAFSGDQVVVRLVQKTKPQHKDELARALRFSVKTALDKNKIKLATGGSSIYVNVKN
ncbi:MAG: mechanosensitive ion channel family protein [Microbacteriaceae bacterium]|nr:mechanosensitive ion channel family protein [Microbacteriaceae bacterium]NBS61858.1 mechanosensitive ion channel family protein [Microbacteriaceae bacterium]